MALWGLIFCIPLHRHMANFWLRALVFGETLLAEIYHLHCVCGSMKDRCVHECSQLLTVYL